MVPCRIFRFGSQTLVAVHGLSCSAACGTLVPQPRVKPTSLALQCRFFTAGPPGKSHQALNRYRILLWEDEKVLEMDDVGGCTTIWIYLILLKHTLKNGRIKKKRERCVFKPSFMYSLISCQGALEYWKPSWPCIAQVGEGESQSFWAWPLLWPVSHPSGLLVPSTLVLGPHYLSLASFSCLTCFTPHVTTRLYTVITGLSPIPLLHFTKHFLASSMCISLLFFNTSLLSLNQETWSQPSPRGNFTLMVSQSTLGYQSKILWIKGLKIHRHLFLPVLVAGVRDQSAADSVSGQTPYLPPVSSPLGSPL